MDAAEAIAELRELSTQIEAVVLASREGQLLASSLDSQTAATVAGSAGSLVEGADAVRRDLGREALAQVQASTAEGSVFVVVDDDRMAIAVTGADPTVGLVFYDLKTLLRQTADAAGDDEAEQIVAEPKAAAEKGDGDGEA